MRLFPGQFLYFQMILSSSNHLRDIKLTITCTVTILARCKTIFSRACTWLPSENRTRSVDKHEVRASLLCFIEGEPLYRDKIDANKSQKHFRWSARDFKVQVNFKIEKGENSKYQWLQNWIIKSIDNLAQIWQLLRRFHWSAHFIPHMIDCPPTSSAWRRFRAQQATKSKESGSSLFFVRKFQNC